MKSCIVMLSAACAFALTSRGVEPSRVIPKSGAVPLPFVANEGQVNDCVAFYSKSALGGSVYITRAGETLYDLPRTADQHAGWLLKESLAGVRSLPAAGERLTPTRVSYFTGRQPTLENASTYECVSLGEVYDRIEYKLRASNASVEKLFYVKPGGNPAQIKINLEGAESLALSPGGELAATTGLGQVLFTRPKAYQINDRRKKEVEVAYVLDGMSYSFKVGAYDPNEELVIDPLILATYFGGSGNDYTSAIAIHDTSVYLTGSTDSPNLHDTTAGAQPAIAGSQDSFVALFSSSLHDLLQVTYLGGTGDDIATALAVSSSNVYVTGKTTSTDFPKTAGGAQPNAIGLADGFVAMFTLDLKSLVQSTYLGGTDNDQPNAIAFANSGNYSVFVAGETYSTDFPKTAGGAQPLNDTPKTAAGTSVYDDGFVAALTADLTSITQATYLGGKRTDSISSLLLTPGFAYVGGYTQSTDFPKTAGGPQSIHYPGDTLEDGFVALLTSDLTTLMQATYLGGGAQDRVNAISSLGSDIYVAGSTLSPNFPGTSGGAQIASGGYEDGFAARYDSSLTTLKQATYLGGAGLDRALGIFGSPSGFTGGDIYVVGFTSADVTPPYDAFVALFSPDLTVKRDYQLLGGTGSDFGVALAMPDPIYGYVLYVAGQTTSTDFPNTTGILPPIGPNLIANTSPITVETGIGGAQQSNAGQTDAFIARMILTRDYVIQPIDRMNVAPGGTGSSTVDINSLNHLPSEQIKGQLFATPQGGALPAGFTPTFNGFESGFFDVSLPSDGSTSFTLGMEVGPTVAPGTYQFWLVGLPGTGVAHAVPVVVNVSPTFASAALSLTTLTVTGCIDSAGVSSALQSKLDAANVLQQRSQIKAAINVLNAFQSQVQAQKGTHIATACNPDGTTVDPAALLIGNAQSLINTLSTSP